MFLRKIERTGAVTVSAIKVSDDYAELDQKIAKKSEVVHMQMQVVK